MPDVDVMPTQQAATVEPVQAPVEPPQEPVQAVEPIEPVQEPVEPQLQRYVLRVDGKDVEVDESEIKELAQKGFSFNQRMQAIAEMERANQQKLQLADGLLNSPEATKFVLAKQLGYDPNMVLGNVQPPDPSWRETYPEQFGRAQAQYELAQNQRQAFESTVSNMLALNAQSANDAVFQKARLENNLDDTQYQQVRNFVTQRFRPNPNGMFSAEDVNLATMALFGRDRIASEKLKNSQNIQQTIKQAGSTRGQVSQRPENISPQSKEAREYKEFVERASRGWTAKG